MRATLPAVGSNSTPASPLSEIADSVHGVCLPYAQASSCVRHQAAAMVVKAVAATSFAHGREP